MSGSQDIRIEAMRRRLFTMIGVDIVAVIAAVGLMLGYMRTDAQWMLIAFILAIAAGMAVQVWLILSWRKDAAKP